MDCNIVFLLCTCDNYEDLWGLFFSHLKKFWPEMSCRIYLCTESKQYSFDGFEIINPLYGISDDLSQWSYRLTKLLTSINEEYIIFMLDDFIITQNVKHDIVEKAYDFMKRDSSIGYICLHKELSDNTSEFRKSRTAEAEIPELHKCLKGLPYRITTQAGIWRKSFLLKILRNHESAWQFEVRGNIRTDLFYNKYKIYDVNDKVVEYPSGGIIWRGRFQKEFLSLFEKDTIQSIINKRGIITREELELNAKKRKKTIKDVWHLLRSFSPF